MCRARVSAARPRLHQTRLAAGVVDDCQAEPDIVAAGTLRWSRNQMDSESPQVGDERNDQGCH
jgi:hypothetical protein